MSKANVTESESTQTEELMSTAREYFEQQTLTNSSATTNEDIITKVEDDNMLSEDDMVHLRQPKLKHKATLVLKVHGIAYGSNYSGVGEETEFIEVQENHKKTTIIEERLREVRALDCNRLENMNLAFWQEKRLGQRSTEAALDLKSVEKLEYLSLVHLDLAYLQQQRRAEQQVAMAPTRDRCADDFSANVELETRGRFPQYSSVDQSLFHPDNFEKTDRISSLEKQSQVNRDSRVFGTLSNEIDSFTSYYYVGCPDGPSEMDDQEKSGAGLLRPQACAISQPQQTVDPVSMTKYTDRHASKDSLNKATATTSSDIQHAAKVMTLDFGSLETAATARAATISGSLTLAGETSIPKARSSQVKSNTRDQAINTAKVTPVKNTTANFRKSQGKSNSATVTPALYAQGSKVVSNPMTPVNAAAPKPLSSGVPPERTEPDHSGILDSQGSSVQSKPMTFIQSATPMILGQCDKPKSTALTNMTSPNSLKNHEIPNPNANKTQTIQSKGNINEKSQSPRRRQDQPSITKSWTMGPFRENRSLQETSDVPSLDTTERPKTHVVENNTNSKLDGARKPAEVGSCDVQDDMITVAQVASPPKTLSKSARKKANQKQNKAMQKERERKEVAEIEAAIASSQFTVLNCLAMNDVIVQRCQNDPTWRTTAQNIPLPINLEVPPEELVPRAVGYFLFQLHQVLQPGSRHWPKQLPLPQNDLRALVRKGYAFFDHTYTDSPPPTEESVNSFVDQVLPLVKQIVPVLDDLTRTNAFTRNNIEYLLLGCIDALSRLVQRGLQHPEIPRSKFESASRQFHGKNQNHSLSERPTSLQSWASHPAIAAAERAFTEHQKSQASPPYTRSIQSTPANPHPLPRQSTPRTILPTPCSITPPLKMATHTQVILPLPILPDTWSGEKDFKAIGKLSAATQRSIEPVGPHFLAHARRARHKRTFSEDDRIQAQENVKKVEDDDSGEISEPEDPMMLSRDAKDWKSQDHYAVLGLSKYRYRATEEQIKRAHRKKVLRHHPDKKAAAGSTEDDSFFKCIQKATEILLDPIKRRQFDSVDEHADVEPPTKKQLKEGKYYKLWSNVFKSEGRFSRIQPVPKFGDENSNKEDVDTFYNFFYNFDSWRSFEYQDEDVPDDNENRDQKRHMERKNNNARKKKKTEDSARLRKLVDDAMTGDERIKRFRQEANASKNKKRLEKEAAEKKALDDAKAAKEAEAKAAKEAEEKAKSEREQGKKAKEAAKAAVKKNRRVLKGSVKDANYFVSGDAPASVIDAVLNDVELVQGKIDADETAALAGKLNGLKIADEIKGVWSAEVKRLVSAGKIKDADVKSLA